MKTSDFNFVLPEELIARYPLKNRTESRLLYLNESGDIKHYTFNRLPELLQENDVLIFNNTRVMPARLYGKKTTGGKVEILIERILAPNSAIALIKSNKTLKLPCKIILENDDTLVITERCDDFFKVELKSANSLKEILSEVGKIPLPGYMERQAEELDRERYQTVYAAHEGAVAAPTAGLHFDQELLENLKEKNIQCGFITLHVGAGTFKPVTVENITDHKMHQEIFEISPEVCELVNKCKQSKGGRVIAVGTTTVRTLESALQNKSELETCSGETKIFIYPGYRFRCVDALITNFHLPKSTLLMLVCAFGGYDKVMSAYQTAIEDRYRFYSYGDAMFLSLKYEI